MITRREFLLRTLLATLLATATFCVAAFVTIRTALAREGEPGRPRTYLSIAGTLSEVPVGSSATMPVVEIQFRRVGTEVCRREVTLRRDATTGSFTGEIDLERATPGVACPPDLFDGRNVEARALIAGMEIAPYTAINPVPYAFFAMSAGSANLAVRAAVTNQYDTPDCPVGYERTSDAATPSGRWLCRRGMDEVVRVGDGASAFWIDRYEATVWRDREGRLGLPEAPLTPYGAREDNYDRGFPDNGQWSRPRIPGVPGRLLFAVSRRDVQPSRFITWFQANEACAASGKRLPTGAEWLRAAQGTPDPGTTDGSNGRCRTGMGGGFGAAPRTTSSATGVYSLTEENLSCKSEWGAEDMIGNVQEWTADWHAGLGRADFGTEPGIIGGCVACGAPLAIPEAHRGMPQWPRDSNNPARNSGWPTFVALYPYDRDSTNNINSAAHSGDGTTRFGIPSAEVRGGAVSGGNGAGIWSLDLSNAPSFQADDVGFRCVIPR
ncbi:MAG: SUMF1/EgtB/PvdO family nonheme iron enzyme [Deltaproteobacteria bacterium]|nr:SUMF1/EgtB/PvdO family nonheme iron enzyme [Deltaproteobacteria bacterium]